MSTEFAFVGWNTEGTSDKVWGYFLRPTDVSASQFRYANKDNGWNCCVFWGRRGKTMHFKSDVTGYELRNLVDAKLKKKYKKITEVRLLEIWPNFIQEAEAKLMWDVLAGKIK